MEYKIYKDLVDGTKKYVFNYNGEEIQFDLESREDVDILHVLSFTEESDIIPYLEEILGKKSDRKILQIVFLLNNNADDKNLFEHLFSAIKVIEKRKKHGLKIPYEKIGYKIQIGRYFSAIFTVFQFVKANKVPVALEVIVRDFSSMRTFGWSHRRKLLNEYKDFISSNKKLHSLVKDIFAYDSAVSLLLDYVTTSMLGKADVREFLTEVADENISMRLVYHEEDDDQIKILFSTLPFTGLSSNPCRLEKAYGMDVSKYDLVKNDPVALRNFSIKRRICYKQKTDLIDEDTYFMAVAVLSSMRSKDPDIRLGACIVKGGKVLSAGYNYPVNFVNLADTVDVEKSNHLFLSPGARAILNFKGNNQELKGSTIYVETFPLIVDAEFIVEAGIQEVVYMSNEFLTETNDASRQILEKAGVVIRHLEKEVQIKLILDSGKNEGK